MRSTQDPDHEDHRRLLYEAVAVGVVVVIAVVFVLKNSHPAPVDLIVTTKSPRLIWVMLGCLGAGFGVGFWVGGPWRTARRNRR